MARDSLYNEQIAWTGGPSTLSVPPLFKVVAFVSATVSVVTLAFAVVVATGLRMPVGGLLLFSAWSAAIAAGAWRLPLWFRASARYTVTDRHVIWQRGRLRRTIERGAISYAVIRWSKSHPGVGDLVLERAVPTGALRRTLTVTFADVDQPDRLWAIVRGLSPSTAGGDGSRALAQRLDDGERVLWTGSPSAARWTVRRVVTTLGATAAGAAAAQMLWRVVPPIARVLRAHVLSPVTSGLLVAGVALAVLLLSTVAVLIGYAAVVQPVLLARKTRYFVTDRRVLIRRGAEELHLDRQRIAYTISAPWSSGGPLRDLFLVLDGPQARAFSPSGAFGKGGDEQRLVPVFAAIEDADTPSEILHVGRIHAETREAA
ncbi:MAG: hypothetical protein JWP97_915 [Labilithrix sp.]|nr:hypothetical protein [Labilithrix sp.]